MSVEGDESEMQVVSHAGIVKIVFKVRTMVCSDWRPERKRALSPKIFRDRTTLADPENSQKVIRRHFRFVLLSNVTENLC